MKNYSKDVVAEVRPTVDPWTVCRRTRLNGETYVGTNPQLVNEDGADTRYR